MSLVPMAMSMSDIMGGVGPAVVSGVGGVELQVSSDTSDG